MAATIVSIDPGSKESAWLMYYCGGSPVQWGKEPNEKVLERVRGWPDANPQHLVIESMVSYGQVVGEEVFSTCVWIGRFIEAWGETPYSLLRRADIKRHICGTDKARDSGVREALITRWGGEEKAVGGKRCPSCKGSKGHGRGSKRFRCDACGGSGTASPHGPLFGITSDCWSALAIAVTYADTNGDMRKLGDAPLCQCGTITVRQGDHFKCLNCGHDTPDANREKE